MVTKQNRDRQWFGIRHTVKWLCLTIACSFTFELVAPSDADALNRKNRAKITKIIPPAVGTTCDVGTAEVLRVINTNSLIAALNDAHKNIRDQWGSIDAYNFGHTPKRPTPPATTPLPSQDMKDEQQDAWDVLKKQREGLWKLATRIASIRIPACDKCTLLNKWGKLRYVGQFETGGKFGSHDVKNIKEEQITNTDVILYVDDYITLRKLRATAPSYPIGASSAVITKMDKDCQDELNKDNPSSANCNVAQLDRELALSRNDIKLELDKVTTGKTLSYPSGHICEPSSNYPYLHEARKP